MPTIAQNYKFEYFPRGSAYSAKSDFQRFVTLDYNMESYVGVIGVGVIDGWTIEQTTNTEIQILPGRGIIDGYFAESPYVVKKRSDMVVPEREIEIVKLQESQEPDMTASEEAAYILVIQDYDPSFSPDSPVENAYVKVVIPTTMTLPNEEDSYVWVQRKYLNPYPPLADFPPYLLSEPSINDFSTFDEYTIAKTAYDVQMQAFYDYEWRDDPANHFTEVIFVQSTTFTPSPSKVLIGRVTTRSNEVRSVDTSNVDSLQKFEATIKRFANKIITAHHHGGSEDFDPPKINLETDVRQAILTSYSPESRKGNFSVLESQLSTTQDGHRHTFSVDSDGNGQTVGIIGTSDNHFHKIVSGIVQTQEFTTGNVSDHIHELPDVSKLTWDANSEYIVYVSGIPVGDNNSTDIIASPENKTISLVGIIGGITKTYGINFEYEGSTFNFSEQQSGVYRFILRAMIQFNLEFPDADINTNPFVFFDEETQSIAGIGDLKDQSATAEALLRESGDTFVFTPNAARNIEVTLLDYQKVEGLESDNVTIEILGNSEVSGVIKTENIFFVNAQKVATGIFSIEQIPFLSHVGRINEGFSSFPYPLISKDGVEFIVTPSITETTLGHYHNLLVTDKITGLTENTYTGDEPVYYEIGTEGQAYLIAHLHTVTEKVVEETSSQGLLDWQNDINATSETDSAHTHEIVFPISGDAKVVYAMSEDRHGNLYVGTSDDLIMIPSDEAFLFVINDIQFYETGTDLLTMFESAKQNYESQTGEPLKISSDIYTVQIALAEEQLTNDGDSYLIIGSSDSASSTDQTMIQKVGHVPIPNYKSTDLKDLNEVGDNEVVTEVQLRDTTTGALLDPTNEDVIAQIAEDPNSVKSVAKVEKSFSDIPAISIRVQDVTVNGVTSDKILTAGADVVATSQDLQDSFYFDWESPDTPSTVGVLKKADQDEEGSVWVATNNGILVLRDHNQSTIFSRTTRPGIIPDIRDIFVFNSSNIYCATDGIYISNDQGKTWTEQLEGDFKQIVSDLSAVVVSKAMNHTHTLNVNANGDGTLEETDGHTHTVSNWVVGETNSHIHDLEMTLYAVSEDDFYRSKDNGENWTFISKLPEGENGKFFAHFGNVFIAKPDGIYRLGGDWERVSQIIAHSFQPSYDLQEVYVGSLNHIYVTSNGTTFETYYEFTGNPLPILQLNELNRHFGYSYSNRGQVFYLNGIIVTDQEINSKIVFDKWFAENGSWDASAPYEIFINDKLILSTKDDIDNRAARNWSFEVFPETGIIDFSGETTLSDTLAVFDNFISVADGSQFQSGDSILIKEKEVEEVETTSDGSFESATASAEVESEKQRVSNTYLYRTITSISSNTISFSPRSTMKISSGSTVVKIPNLDADSTIIVNIYDSNLSNIGTHTHQELEDKLSYESDQRPYELNNSYLSNLLQLTQAVRYVFPDVNSAMIQSIFYDFHYSTNPNDDNYVGNFVDLANSEAYSLVNFQSPFEKKGALAINKILIGTGTFSGNIIVGTDIGVFWAVLSDGVNANWFYVWNLAIPVYDMQIFGEENLLVATNEGVYSTQDMITWTLQDQEAVRFPALSMSLRWPQDSFEVISSHTATFDNSEGTVTTGAIISSGNLYEGLVPNRSIKIETPSDPSNAINNTSYIITRVYPNAIHVSPPFNNVPETITDVVLTVGSWWQQFDGEDNVGNASLTNTLLVGGQNKIAYTPYLDDFIWTSSLFETGIDNVNIVSFLPLSTGGILASAVGTDQDNVVNHILRSSDIGKNWSSFKKFEEIRGTISSSKSTSFGHSELTVSYTFPSDLRYANGEFDKLRIAIFEEGSTDSIFTGRVTYNDGFDSTIIAFGQGANEAVIQSNADLSFKIYQSVINDMVETSNKNILFGTDIGVYEDSQTTTGEFPYYGTVWSVGEPGTVANIDISGVIKSVSVNPVNNAAIVSVLSDSNISSNQFQGDTLYIVDLPTVAGFTITSNTFKNVGGEVTIEVSDGFDPIWLTYLGKNVKLVGSQSTLDVEFSFVVKNNQYKGGTLTVSSDENLNRGTVYNIVSNTQNQIIIDASLVPLNQASPDATNADLIAGQSFILLDSSGKIPIDVTFTQGVVDNFLADFELQITNGDSEASLVDGMVIYQNSRNKMVLNDFSELMTSESITLPIALIIQPNDGLRAVGPIYQPLSSFNNKATTTDSSHYHELDLVGSFISGAIDSFTEILSATVEFDVTDTDGFDSALVQKDGSLFKDARIRFFNPQQIGVEYFSEVISHDSNSIKVKLLSSNDWNFTEYSITKTSETWKWEIDATNYGYTKDIFYDDFVTSSTIVTEDFAISDTFVKVVDTSSMVVGDKILIVSDADKSEENFVKSVVDATTIELSLPAKNTYFVANTVQVKVLRDEFSNTHEHMVRNNQVATISVEDYLNKGYPSQHSHRNIAFIDVISDMESNNNEILVAGSSSFIYNSGNGGNSWSKLVDLNDFTEGSIEIDNIVNLESLNGQTVAGTGSGTIFSTGGGEPEILPLDQPEVNQ